jgi:hypothetical protein
MPPSVSAPPGLPHGLFNVQQCDLVHLTLAAPSETLEEGKVLPSEVEKDHELASKRFHGQRSHAGDGERIDQEGTLELAM